MPRPLTVSMGKATHSVDGSQFAGRAGGVLPPVMPGLRRIVMFNVETLLATHSTPGS